MTFDELLTDLRSGNVPNATQNETLLILAEALKALQDTHKDHCHFSHGPGITSEPVTTYPPYHE